MSDQGSGRNSNQANPPAKKSSSFQIFLVAGIVGLLIYEVVTISSGASLPSQVSALISSLYQTPTSIPTLAATRTPIPTATSTFAPTRTAMPMSTTTFTPRPTNTPSLIPAFFSMTTENRTVALGTTFLVTLNLDSPNQGVDAADFVVNFDPAYLKATMVSGGNYFGLYPVKSADANHVKISGIAKLVDNTFLIPIGQGVAGIIAFQTLSVADRTRISFDREKTIVASKGENILDPQKIIDLDVTIK